MRWDWVRRPPLTSLTVELCGRAVLPLPEPNNGRSPLPIARGRDRGSGSGSLSGYGYGSQPFTQNLGLTEELGKEVGGVPEKLSGRMKRGKTWTAANGLDKGMVDYDGL